MPHKIKKKNISHTLSPPQTQ